MAAVSVVIPAMNEGSNLADTVACVLRNSDYEPLEIVIVDDGSTDGSVEAAVKSHPPDKLRIVRSAGAGVARARNAGAAAAGGDVFIFLDGHCYVPSGWVKPLLNALQSSGVGLVGPAFTSIRDPRMKACGVTWKDPSLKNVWLPSPESVVPRPFHIGACQAVRADAFWAVGGYDAGMTRWGSEDIELCLRMWLFGYEVLAQPDSLVYHLFRTSRPYTVENRLVLYNHLRLAILHFDEVSLQKVLHHALRFPEIEKSLALALTDGVWECRQRFHTRRVRDFTWFCKEFDIEL